METGPFFCIVYQNLVRTVIPYMRGSSTNATRERVPAPPRSGVLEVMPRVISFVQVGTPDFKGEALAWIGEAEAGVDLEVIFLTIERQRYECARRQAFQMLRRCTAAT
jgi:hypothetical protein